MYVTIFSLVEGDVEQVAKFLRLGFEVNIAKDPSIIFRAINLVVENDCIFIDQTLSKVGMDSNIVNYILKSLSSFRVVIPFMLRSMLSGLLFFNSSGRKF